MLFHKFYDIPSQGKYLCLATGSNESPDVSFDRSYQCLHQVFVADEFECHFLDRIFIFILHRIQ